jgi:hypothetical protein
VSWLPNSEEMLAQISVHACVNHIRIRVGGPRLIATSSEMQRGKGCSSAPPPRNIGSRRFESYGRLTVVPSPALVMVKVPEVVEL